MPKAELTNVSGLIQIETCGHFMCSCKTTLDDDPMTASAKVGALVDNEGILTSLDIMDDNGNRKTVQVSGVHRPDRIVEAFNEADGKMSITDAGLVCCALDRLGRQ